MTPATDGLEGVETNAFPLQGLMLARSGDWGKAGQWNWGHGGSDRSLEVMGSLDWRVGWWGLLLVCVKGKKKCVWAMWLGAYYILYSLQKLTLSHTHTHTHQCG